MKFIKKHQKLWFVLFLFFACLTLAACSVNWVTELESSLGAFSPALAALFGLLSAFGTKIPSSVLSTIQSVYQQIENDIQNVVLPLIQQYNAAEADAKPGILGQIQSAMASCTENMGAIQSAIQSAGLSGSDLAKATAIVQALTIQLDALVAFLPVIEGDEASVKAAVASGNVPMNAEQWVSHFNQVLAHGTGNTDTDSAIGQVTPIVAPVRA